jgi:hypothetical protein
VRSVPVLQIRTAGVCANDDGSGDDGGCPMGWVRPNGARIGHAGCVRLRWGRAQRIPEVRR